MTKLSGTRRAFFGKSAMALAAQRMPSFDPKEQIVDYYDKLGVTKITNAAGTYTFLTARIIPPQVQAAVADAAKHPVRLAELQKAAGEYLAKTVNSKLPWSWRAQLPLPLSGPRRICRWPTPLPFLEC